MRVVMYSLQSTFGTSPWKGFHVERRAQERVKSQAVWGLITFLETKTRKEPRDLKVLRGEATLEKGQDSLSEQEWTATQTVVI